MPRVSTAQTQYDDIPEEQQEKSTCGTDRPPCGRGWFGFWLAVLLAYGPTLVAELIIVSLAVKFFGEELTGGDDPCQVDDLAYNVTAYNVNLCNEAITKVTSVQAVSTSVAYLVAFFGSSLAGSLCDKIGRKPVLFMSACLLSLHSAALMGVYKGLSPYYWYVAIGFAGILPANVAWGAVLVDRTLPAERAPVFAWLLAGENLDGVILPLIVAFAPVEASIWMIIGFMIVMLLLIVVAIPETMPKARREEIKLHQEESDQPAPGKFSGLSYLVSNPKLRTLSALAFSSSFMVTGVQAILLPFYKAKFNLDYDQTAPLFATYYAAMFFMNVVLMKPMIFYLGLKNLLLFSYFGWTVFSIGMYFVSVEWQILLYLMMVISCFAAAALPGFFALLNSSVSPDMRGQIVGAMIAIQSLGKMCGPLVYNLLFTASLSDSSASGFLGQGDRAPGTVFLFSAFLQIISLVVISCMPRALFKDDDEDDADAPLTASG